MKIDGVSAEVLYPSLGLLFWRIQDSELFSAATKPKPRWEYILERWQRHGRCKHQCVGSGL